MALLADLRILYHLVVKPVRGESHADRMESFYAGQAAGYDDFRRRLLRGRQEMYDRLEVPAGGVWVELGGGTGSNLEFLGDRIQQLSKVYVVDLSKSLLEVARRRASQRNWRHVEAVIADAATFRPPDGHADVVTFSYSLTMIPDWFIALENAAAMLSHRHGTLGVVDFHVSRKHAARGCHQHGWLTRTFWPSWFATDNVYPSTDHVPYLHWKFTPIHFSEHRTRVPYLPLGRVPYYCFIGHPRPLRPPFQAPRDDVLHAGASRGA
jgi:S-adenosylmethionine-diacylgycerolhomoserine-N-methlytransferase